MAAAVDARRAQWPIHDDHPVPAGGPTAIDRLTTIFAAAAAGRAALVCDPAWPPPALGVVPPETFLITVTSGTSGTPRPVLRTAASWTSSFCALSELASLTADDRVLLTGPLHSTLHLFAGVHTLGLGAELTDRAETATAVHAAPAMLAALLRTLPAHAPLRVAIVAGSALPDDIAAAAIDRGIAVVEYYGAAELSFVGVRRWPEPLRPFPGADVQIRTTTAGRPGQIWVRSEYLASGYPAGCSGPLQRVGDGFATVGDLGDPLPDGAFRVRGRGDAAITTGGHTVLADDVERALAALPGVTAAAVVGVPHRELGEVVTAVIEPAPGTDLSSLRHDARRRLSGPSLPRRWFLTDRLPRTPSGKVRRGPVIEAVEATVSAARHATNPAPSIGATKGPGSPQGLPRLRPLP